MREPIVRIGYPWWLRPVVARNTVAVTLGRRIWIDADWRGDMEALLRHERAHVRQMGELGMVRFLWRYVAEYLRHRRAGMRHDAAYRAISFEAEAFAAEQDESV